MGKAKGPTGPEEFIENHPWRHKWNFTTDEVVKTKRDGTPTQAKRYEHCDDCPTILVTTLDVRMDCFEVLGKRYIYAKNVVILRKPKNKWLQERFLATTNITWFKEHNGAA